MKPKNYDAIYDRTGYLISLKSNITYILSHYFAKVKVDSNDSLPIEKTLTFHNVIIHIQSSLNKDKSHYYYKILLDKCTYQLLKKLKIVGIYKKSILFWRQFFLLFWFGIYKMVDTMDIYKPLNIGIGKLMKNPEMLKFISDHLKTKRMRNHAVKKLTYLLRYVPNQ